MHSDSVLRDASGRDRDPSVAGSSGPENSYILDGVTTTDPAFGGGGANLPFEFVQEVQVKTGAYGADQGLSTGGVFNVITKSGGNEFSGSFRDSLTNPKWISKTAFRDSDSIVTRQKLRYMGDVGGEVSARTHKIDSARTGNQ